MQNEDEIWFPRLATILNENNVVSSIGLFQGMPHTLDKRQAEMNAFRRVKVGPDVRVGMIQLTDGSFDWPIGHPEESWEVRKARDAKQVKAIA